MKRATTGRNQIEIMRTIDASIAKVFAAWTDPDLIPEWMPGTEHAESTATTVDSCRGGGYRCEMLLEGGGEVVMQGTNAEFEAPNRIAYTLTWEVPDEADPVPKTKVSVDLTKRGRKTEVSLTHSRLTSEMKDSVSAGWQAAFDRLALALAVKRQATASSH